MNNSSSVVLEPLNLTSPYQTYSSVELEWDPPPVDYSGNETNKGFSPLYSITFSPTAASNGSSCGQGNVPCTTNYTRYNVSGLQFGVNYTFVVTANSSTGIGYSDNLTVLIPGNGKLILIVIHVSYYTI